MHYLGGRQENYAEWKEVYSRQGGTYEMTIHYCSPIQRKLDVWVNGEKHELAGLVSGGEDKVSTVTLPVTLAEGYNCIRMGNDFGWAPDIDCFTLQKK